MVDLEARAIELKNNLDVIMSHFQSISAVCSTEDLSLQELKVVYQIGQREVCIMREISEHMKVAVSTMTGIIDKLEVKKLVKRERTDEDRRIVRVLLTAKGEKLYQAYVENYLELSRRMLQSLNTDEQITYLGLTRKIAQGAAQVIASDSV